ncbi:MAG: hypothetical protein OHK93_007848 [Ramalina farinacea]|uniref:Uncharacterized protein n=1 Tax=Ramalina farinacea TaxID=258253 RepID=A0AA43QPN9_9LECA|nr:hypothetical protein [Ramalina farinacea]
MASLGGMSVSAAFGASHLTAALLNVNFDFALVKYDAPPEYLPLGLSLSRKRRRNAEEGQIHATARQLGALFADVLPSIPNLSKAYGRRVSEIAECPGLNPQGTRSDGPFADFVGADGTSIWAAATSGRGALAAHLLACLIAYMWKPPEATAIWSELVDARKDRLVEQIHDQELDSLAFSILAASRIQIARESLAEWDASARSVSSLFNASSNVSVFIDLKSLMLPLKWLRTADTAKSTEQRRLMLIIDNMNLQVPERSNRYDEVMSVWIKGMTLLENLVSGVAQSVTGPEALLGLCSSHIYPDLCVVGLTHSGESTIVSQKDQHVPEGGLLTIGLSHERARGQGGISWSMPLAHLRYYGRPEERHQQLNSSSPRVSFQQFLLIAMGSLASQWTIRGAPGETIAAFITALIHACSGEVGIPWLIALGNEAQAYLNSSPTARSAMDRFIMLGRRRPEILAAKYHHPSDCFGLCQPLFYLKFMDLDLQVQTLRQLAGELIPEEMLEHAVIISSRLDLDVVECASVRAQIMPGSRQKSHCRWICLPIKVFRSTSSNMFDFDYSPTIVYEDPITQRRWFQGGKDSALVRSMEIICTTGEPCGFFDVPFEAVADEFGEIADEFFHWNRNCHRDPVLTLDELRKGALQSNTSWDLERSTHGWRLGQSLPPYCGKTYKCVFRASGISAVYVPMSTNDQKEKVHPWPDAVPIELVISQLREKTIPAIWIRKYLHHFSAQEHDRYFKYYSSLEALAGAADVYNTLPNAELDLRLQTSLSDFFWMRAWRNNHYHLTVSRSSKEASMTRKIR